MKRADLSVWSKDVRELLGRVGAEADKAGMNVFLVGGMVRDLLIGQASLDIDVAVEGDGFALARKLAAKLKAEIVLHERFRTAVLTFSDGSWIDVVTARRETYAQPGALPDIVPASLKEDLHRRDFTINAIGLQLNAKMFGVLRDDVNGAADLEAKLVRVMHGKSFKDDPTRILRAARYAVRLGFQFESLTQDLVDQAIAADVFKTLTAPRYFLELSRILEEQDPVPALDLLAAWGAVRYIPYETAARGRLAAAAANGWQVRLGAILKGLPSAEIDALFIAFNISHVDRKKITGALQAL